MVWSADGLSALLRIFLDALNPRAELPQLYIHVLVAAVEMVNPVYLRCAFCRETGNHQGR
jgi:hypothetical protein